MKSMGQASYLLDIESLTLQGLVERFTLLSSQRETVCREVAERVADFQLALIRQYEGLFDDV
ncbi:MAG: hypothetical protein AUG12_03185 [Acidobacteria bacterium 13_1_20CM_2_57_8]|nr:MAG: hypothetical protein AUG12_03185 [Acidobacteria bacterium 13_1_20CM_2_57_8]